MSQAPSKTDIFDRTLEDLTDDAETSGNVLSRESVDNLYLRRDISPDQALAIEKALKAQGVSIRDEQTVLPHEPETPSAREGKHPTALDHLLSLARRYPLLNADEEAACAEAIQTGLIAQEMSVIK